MHSEQRSGDVYKRQNLRKLSPEAVPQERIDEAERAARLYDANRNTGNEEMCIRDRFTSSNKSYFRNPVSFKANSMSSLLEISLTSSVTLGYMIFSL